MVYQGVSAVVEGWEKAKSGGMEVRKGRCVESTGNRSKEQGNLPRVF